MLEIHGCRIQYKLSWLEKIGALTKSPSAEVTNLKKFSRDEKPWTTEVLRGIRLPGTGFPFLIMLGTMASRGGRDFCVVYRKRPVLIVEFENEKYKRWVIPATIENERVLSGILPKR